MRVVLDTNVLVSSLLWSGIPHQLLRAAESGRIALYASPALIEELSDVLTRPKFSARLEAMQATPEELIMAYLKLGHLVQPPSVPPMIKQDPDDDAVLACALAASASFIVTGDQHLLRLKSYHAIQIVSPRALGSMLS